MYKIRSERCPLIKDYEKVLKTWSIGWGGEHFGELGFWGNVRRRGAHVSTPEIGSRGGEMCIGEI
jgi:hypothetical protein